MVWAEYNGRSKLTHHLLTQVSPIIISRASLAHCCLSVSTEVYLRRPAGSIADATDETMRPSSKLSRCALEPVTMAVIHQAVFR